MNVLLVGADAQGSLEGIYKRALEGLGCKTELLNVDWAIAHDIGSGLLGRMLANRYTNRVHAWEAGRRFLRHMEHLPRSYDAVIVFKGMQFSPSLLKAAKERQPSALWVNLNPDDPFNVRSRGSTNKHVLHSIRLYDLYCTWSRRLSKRLQSEGCEEVLYLPFACDPALHRPPGKRLARRPQSICFVGAWDKEREAILTALAYEGVRVAGAGWGRVSRASPLKRCVVRGANLYGEGLAQEIEAASVSLNILRPQNETSHNMRTFEIPAIGGLQLTTRSEEQQEYFPEGVASLMYEGLEELKEKAQWAVRHPTEADRVRAGGRRLVEGHTYAVRAKTLIGYMKRLIGK